MSASTVFGRFADRRPEANGLAPPGVRPPTGLTLTDAWASAAAALTVLLAVLGPVVTGVDVRFHGRTPLALAYVLLVPGLPFALLLCLSGTMVTLICAVATSIAVQTLVAQILLSSNHYSALAGQILTSGMALGLVAVLWRALNGVGARPGKAWRLVLRRVGVLGWQALDPTMVVVAAAVGVWSLSVLGINPDHMNGYGLVSVLNLGVVLAFGLLAVAAVMELRRPTLRSVWLGFIAVVLTVFLYGLSPAVESAANVPVAWLHSGFIEYIRNHGHVLNGYDARFSWPAFFAVSGALTTMAGRPSAVGLLQWAPVAFELLVLMPLVLLLRSLATSARAAWLGVFIYLCANWYQQDYFSPQATNFVLYVSVLAVLAWSLVHAGSEPGPVAVDGGLVSRLRARSLRMPAPAPGTTPGSRLSLGLALVLVCAASVVSHQLTPVTLGMALLVFTVTGSTRYRDLWLALGVLFVLWFSFGATDFWVGHLSLVTGDVGNVGGTLNAGVAGRVQGDPQHLVMQYVRVLLSLALFGTAVLGWWLRRRHPHRWLVAGLAVVPFSLIALQSYGGEVVLRVFLFALPALALLSGEALARLVGRMGLGRLRAVALVVLLAVLPIWLLAARGANEPFERVTAGQYAAAREVHRLANHSTSIASFTSFTPLSYADVGRLFTSALAAHGVPCISATSPGACALADGPDIVYTSSSEDAYGQLMDGLPAHWTDRAVRLMVLSGQYKVRYRNADAVVLVRTSPKGG